MDDTSESLLLRRLSRDWAKFQQIQMTGNYMCIYVYEFFRNRAYMAIEFFFHDESQQCSLGCMHVYLSMYV
jgi:hypothetical protein